MSGVSLKTLTSEDIPVLAPSRYGSSILNLADNDLTSIANGTFRHQNAVDFLSLGGNRLVDITAAMFIGLDSLQILNLSSNGIAELSDGIFAELTHLERVYLAGNKIQSIGAWFEPVNHVKILDLSRNPITRLSVKHFERLPQLERLEMSQALVSSVENGALAALEKLVTLDLSHNRLVAFDAAAVFGHVHAALKEIRLGGNRNTTEFVGLKMVLPKLSDSYEVDF